MTAFLQLSSQGHWPWSHVVISVWYRNSYHSQGGWKFRGSLSHSCFLCWVLVCFFILVVHPHGCPCPRLIASLNLPWAYPLEHLSVLPPPRPSWSHPCSSMSYPCVWFFCFILWSQVPRPFPVLFFYPLSASSFLCTPFPFLLLSAFLSPPSTLLSPPLKTYTQS